MKEALKTNLLDISENNRDWGFPPPRCRQWHPPAGSSPAGVSAQGFGPWRGVQPLFRWLRSLRSWLLQENREGVTEHWVGAIYPSSLGHWPPSTQ